MNDFDAAVEWLVTTGRAKSKGEARRRLTEQVALDRIENFSEDERTWFGSMLNGLAGAGPMFGGPTAGASAQAGIDLANRSILFAGQEAAKAVNGLAEAFEVGNRKRSVGDWFEDYGYGLGLAFFVSGGVTALAAPTWWPVGAVLVAVACMLCWSFG